MIKITTTVKSTAYIILTNHLDASDPVNGTAPIAGGYRNDDYIDQLLSERRYMPKVMAEDI